jgi:hypothetical protein
MEKILKKSYPKILFYTGTPRMFRTTLIGHLHIITQQYPTILLHEELDPETNKIIRSKELFPKLESLIPIYQFEFYKKNIFKFNKYLFNSAKNAIANFNPNIVITSSDVDSIFELYLMRFAKKNKSLKISISGTISTAEMKYMAKWFDLINVYSRTPSFLPFFFRQFLINIRKYLGHIIFFYILPLSVGQFPFLGNTSFILHIGHSGMRDSDYHIVFSRREYEFYAKDGVPENKIYIIAHPLKYRKGSIFEIGYFNKLRTLKNKSKIILVMLPAEKIGFNKSDLSLISQEKRFKLRLEIVRIINEVFKIYKILIKPHPIIENINYIKKDFESISPNIEVLDPQLPIDKYIELADVIIDMPRSTSTSIFTASLQCPQKPILSLDFDHEFLGDSYKNFPCIEYFDNKSQFIKILELIRDNKYIKKGIVESKSYDSKEYDNIIELFKDILNKSRLI